jgi:hypothetical protein
VSGAGSKWSRQAREARGLTEADFQRQVTDLAELLGWSWAHFRPAQTAHGWRTPVSGPLGKGWPDIVAVRPRDGRLVFLELKRQGGKPSADQAAVLAALGTAAEVHVWTPADLRDPIEASRIYAVLR